MARSDNLTGALLMMASMAAFTLNDTMMKMLAGEIPLFQLLFLRGVITSVLVGLLAWRMKALTLRLPARDLKFIGVRTVAEIGAAYFFLTALFNMPLANVTAILQALPLTITLTAALVFKEPIGWRRLSAILVGFVGVLLIVRPGAEGFNSYSLYTMAAVAFVTLRDLSTRKLSKETPSMLVTLVTSLAIMIFFGLASLMRDWVPMDMRASTLTLGASLMIIGGYLFSVMVMRVGEISFIAPFRYTGLIWALVLGWLAFGEWPDPVTLAGAAIVVGSGMFMLYREAQLGLVERRAQIRESRRLR
ncbi:DMT family transporter [Roseovarius aestuarii]|uniref:EamA-like transporter family protein n=1 Tax=Roseovarius aestuarii TaxID=475083 RepID=A0A1X7BTH8_9RHOB|nr:DMT family transporter [Roseovarius aestuarii]SMC12922.1 EamA-like transporter family protein [Roseovarius aestuarii]